MNRALTFALIVIALGFGALVISSLPPGTLPSFTGSAPFSSEKEFTFLPSLVSPGATTFGCTAVASAYLNAGSEGGRVTGDVSAGTDKISISIDAENNVLSFITAASVAVGNTEADKFVLVENDETNAVAITNSGFPGGPSYSVIVFDKVTQQAIWTKAKNSITKYGEVIYLNCQ